MEIIEKIKRVVWNRTTYRLGLLQTKAYRILKNHTDEALSQYSLSSVDWAILGLLHDNREGLRSKEVADELGVEAPFVTTLCSKLEKIKFVTSHVNSIDSRAKNIQLTSKGHEFVSSTEEHIHNHMKKLLRGTKSDDLLSYIAVLEKIIENGTK